MIPVKRKPDFCICGHKDSDQVEVTASVSLFSQQVQKISVKDEISCFQHYSVAAQANLYQTLLEILKTGFLMTPYIGTRKLMLTRIASLPTLSCAVQGTVDQTSPGWFSCLEVWEQT